MFTSGCHNIAVAGMLRLLMLFSFLSLAQAYKSFTYGEAEDKKISSDNYPGRYPQGANITWTWDVPSGYWGVVFLDFDLDAGVDGSSVGDWLQISDEQKTPIQYTAINEPVVPFRSQGPRLHIRFVSDKQTGDKPFKGFQLQVLYGSTDTELSHKLIETAKERDRQKNPDDDDKSNKVHVTTAVSLIVVFAVVIILVVLYSRRNIKLLRRQSTMARSERGDPPATVPVSPTSPTSPTSPSSPTSPTSPTSPFRPTSPTSPTSPFRPTSPALPPAAPYTNGNRRPSQPVQRSNSQRDWTARAELSCASIKRTDRSAQPNDYTQAHPSHQTNIKYTINHVGGAADISVSSTITSRSRPAATADQAKSSHNHGADMAHVTPPRRLRSTQSEKIMTTSGACAYDGSLFGRKFVSESKLSAIFDDPQELNGAGNYVDTIDRLDPIPLEAIRGKKQLPVSLTGEGQAPHSLGSTRPPPPPYFSQSSSDSSSFYENVTLSNAQAGYRRKSSLYANTPCLDEALGSENRNISKDSEADHDQSTSTWNKSSRNNQIHSDSPMTADTLGEYTYLASPSEGEYCNTIERERKNDFTGKKYTACDTLNQVMPVADNIKTITRSLNSAYDKPRGRYDPHDKPLTSDDPYDKPPKGDDPYDIPPTSANLYNKPPANDDPYDKPPASDNRYEKSRGRYDPHDKPLTSDDPYDIPPTSANPYDRPPASDDRHEIPPASDDPYDIPPRTVSLSDVPPTNNLNYVPAAAVASLSSANSDYPYDIPPSRHMD
ncbi:repetitive proline-rich cell wall protein 2 [Plakobranchus ocellatus]|uniref:Repetitive proline-rich cell wall protein 2 n=1 Tax=Plakobranchus ocellatus TaxID=259542 RepID=A0AAV4AUR9_9GAST|nr:repetitive proline-rich cell wall protein 2 [Plakobranchus ocellatus]